MFEWRGRALAYPAIILAGWITGRTFMLIGAASVPGAAPAAPPPNPPLYRAADPHPDEEHTDVPVRKTVPRSGQVAGLSGARHIMLARLPIIALPVADQSRPLAATLGQPSDRPGTAAHAGYLAPALHRPNGDESRFSAYGYMFWRPDGGGPGVAPTGQYGGSQAAIQLAYDLSGQTDRGLALHGRASFAPAGKQKELAIGLRWNRPARLPVTLIAERRLNPDGGDRWAAFVAGGFDPKPLPLGFALDGYVQAGWAGGRDATGFFDAQARMVRPVLTLGETQIKAGAGVWAGGEDSAQRLDIGPAVAAAIPLGRARIELRFDWRQRIAGSAQPGSGPAVTVATGF